MPANSASPPRDGRCLSRACSLFEPPFVLPRGNLRERGGCFSAFPTRLVGWAQAPLQLRLQPLQMAGRTDKSFQNRAVIFDFSRSSKRPDLVSVVHLPTGRGALSAGASRV